MKKLCMYVATELECFLLTGDVPTLTESDGAVGTEEDVACLEVAVDAATGVETLQGLQHLVSDAADLRLRQTVVQL